MRFPTLLRKLWSIFAPTPVVWTPYDPSWLVAAAEASLPQDARLLDGLRQCREAIVESPYYVRFVPAESPNEPDSIWQFSHNVLLEGTEHGDVVIDVLKSGKVGGVEFLSRLIESGG